MSVFIVPADVRVGRWWVKGMHFFSGHHRANYSGRNRPALLWQEVERVLTGAFTAFEHWFLRWLYVFGWSGGSNSVLPTGFIFFVEKRKRQALTLQKVALASQISGMLWP